MFEVTPYSLLLVLLAFGVVIAVAVRNHFHAKRHLNRLHEKALALEKAQGDATRLRLQESEGQRASSEERLATSQGDLLTSEERFRLAVEGSYDGIWDWWVDTGACYYSARFKEQLGYSPGEVPDEINFFVAHVHPEDKAQAFGQVRQHFKDRLPYSAVCRLMTKDGDYRWYMLRGQARWNAEGRATRMAGSMTDITESKQTEKTLLHYAQQLERLNESLELRNKELDEFTYVASHDLQEPLRKLTTFSDLLRQDIGTELNEDATYDLEAISTSARRMQTLVQDLLALSRSGRQEMRRAPVDLNRCVENALQALSLRIEERGALVETAALPTVIGDPMLLTQLYQNLIDNALKFQPQERPEVRLTYACEYGKYIFGVQDRGIGIKPEYQTRIFVPFKRLHSREEYEGTGIGLAICSKIIERHDGKLWVESELGAGSHFKFTLELQTEKLSGQS